MKELKYEDLFKNEIEDLYDAERQIMDALPKMIESSTSEELAAALEDHLQQTAEQVRRLERVFESIGEEPGGKKCEGMRGLLREGEQIMLEIEKSPVMDAALIAAAQKVEHYEISGYGTASSLAAMLGQQDAADLLDETLEEEKETDDILTEIAESIMSGDAVEEDAGEEMEEEDEVEDEELRS